MWLQATNTVSHNTVTFVLMLFRTKLFLLKVVAVCPLVGAHVRKEIALEN